MAEGRETGLLNKIPKVATVKFVLLGGVGALNLKVYFFPHTSWLVIKRIFSFRDILLTDLEIHE